MSRKTEVASVELPKTLGIWTRSEQIRKILPDKIFDYMDGAGELYIGYRFKHLEVAEYSAADEDQILVELYWMDSSEDAFGLLSGDWGGEPVDLGQSVAKPAKPGWLPDHRALYGAGLLRIWSDNLYARVMAYRETTRSKEMVLKLGMIITAGRGNPPAPNFLDALPQNAASSLRLRTDRICYFRSHLVLNSAYFLSTRNILDLGHSVEAVTAPYSSASGASNRGSVQLILVRYADQDAAQAALAHFERIYLPEKGKSVARLPSGGPQYMKIEDGWVGYSRSGRTLALVFECPERELAVHFLTDAVKQLNELEDHHE